MASHPASHPAVRSLQYWAYQYKRTWRGSLVSSTLNPVLFLAAMGLGLGSLVDKSGQSSTRLGGVDYLTFLAPGLLAAAAMQTAANESSWPVLASIKWRRTYHGMLATPLRVGDVLAGHLLWIAFRVTIMCGVFLAVMAGFGATASWTALLIVPAGVLTGVAFAAPIMAMAATVENDQALAALYRFVIIPMSLFSGTFFPVSQLPAWLRPVAYLTPLWHGVDLCRSLALGRAQLPRTTLHVLYLVMWTVAGIRRRRGCLSSPAGHMTATGRMLVARVSPPALFGSRRARRLVERNLMVYRRLWLIVVSGFFEPLFYLLSIGVGIGELVGHIAGPGGHPIAYTTFVAPALMASSAMNAAVYESTMNIFFKLKEARTYDAVLATPMTVGDVALGEITWALMRGLLYATAFLAVMVALGDVASAWAVLALPAAVLIGFAFAAVGTAATTYMRSWQDFDFVQLATLPLFLFSATFYPLSTYPRWLQLVVQCSPLFHGVALIRGFMLGRLGPDLLVHTAYLAIMGLIGLRVASKRLGRLLLA